MILKNVFLNKYNIYLTLLFFIISVFGSIYLYKNKELHNYSYVYKIQIPHLIKLDKVGGIGTNIVPMISAHEFNEYILKNQSINKNCQKFTKNVRLNRWASRNMIDWRFEIRNINPKNIELCANQIIEEIQKKRQEEILRVEMINEFESLIFKDSVKEIINNYEFKKFKDFVKEEAKKLETFQNKIENDISVDDKIDGVMEVLVNALRLNTLNINEKLSAPRFTNNFLSGYVYNFLESYKSMRYMKSMSETKIEKISESYFLKKNILKFNMAILFLLMISLIFTNAKDIKKIF
jgi:hypothetical protein